VRKELREIVDAAAKKAGCYHGHPRHTNGETGQVIFWGEREAVRACMRELGMTASLTRAWGEELQARTGVLAGSVCYRDARTGELLDRASATLSHWSLERAGLEPAGDSKTEGVSA
jgi:hypothetical protein